MTLAAEVLSRLNESGLAEFIKGRSSQIDGEFFQALSREAARKMSAGDLTGASSIAAAGIAAADLIRSPSNLVTFVSILAQCLAPRDPARARKMLSDIRELCHKNGDRPGVVHLELVLTFICMREKDLTSATEYALSLQRTYQSIQPEEWRGEPPSSGEIAQVVYPVAQALYYEVEKYDSAATLSRWLTELNPADRPALTLLGNSLLRLKQFEAALEPIQRAISLDPSDPQMHTSLAGALVSLNRVQEGLAAISEAIRLAPNEPKSLLTRAQYYRYAENPKAAIEDFQKVLAWCEHAPAAGAEENSPVFHSKAQFMRELPVKDLADLAKAGMLAALLESNREEEAISAAGEAARSPDTAVRSMGARVLAQIYKRHGNVEETLKNYRLALEATPKELDLLEEFSAYLIELKHFDEALEYIKLLSGPQGKPEAALKMLGQMATENPGHPEILKYRGYTRLTLWHPRKAIADLSKAIEQLPNDSRLYFWRGLAQIHSSVDEEDKDWDKEFSYEQVHASMEDFGHAANLDPADAEALGALRWLFDRASSEPGFLALLRRESDKKTSIFSLIPQLCSAVDAVMVESARLEDRREWKESIKILNAAQTNLRELGFTLFATRVNSRLADNYIQLHEIQKALDCLKQADELMFIQTQPLTSSLHPQAERWSEQTFSRTGQKSVALEPDYLIVSTLGWADENLRIRILRAHALARMGEGEAAFKALGNLTEIFEGTPATRTLPVRSLRPVVMVVRDSGRYDLALQLLDKLRKRELDPDDEIWIENTTGVIWMKLNQMQSAAPYLERACELTKQYDASHLFVVQLNLAQVRSSLGDPAGALEITNEIPIGKVARSIHDEINYYTLRAVALWELNRNSEAQNEIEQAVKRSETTREKFRSSEGRISILSNYGEIYRMAVRIALSNGDAAKALEFSERFKARSFVDQLTAGRPPLTQEGEKLNNLLTTLREKRGLIKELLLSLQQDGETFINYEVLNRLLSLDPDIKIFQEGEARDPSAEKMEDELQKLERSISRIEAEIEEIRFQVSESVSGAVTNFGELQEVLRNTARKPPVVLVEYFLDDFTALFVVRSGDPAPLVKIVNKSLEQVQAFLDQHLQVEVDAEGRIHRSTANRIRDLDEAVFQDFFAPLLAPLFTKENGEEPLVREGEILWIVPSETLHYVPLHAVKIQGRYVIERNPVCYSPSASAMALCIAREGAGLGESALVLGDSRDDLPYARDEALSIGALLGTEALVGLRATKAALKAALGSSRSSNGILHIACHGVFNAADALKSGIVLAEDRSLPAAERQEDAMLTAQEIFALTFPSRVTVLSACESGLSEKKTGDELIGLTRSVLSSGSSSVVVSLWSVDDLSTGLLMQEFYNALRGVPPRTKVEALQQAQNTVRKLTLRQVIAHCDGRLAALRTTNEWRAIWLEMDRARFQEMAGDLNAAIAAYREIEHKLSQRNDERSVAQRTSLQLLISTLEERAQSEQKPDYEIAPFASLYHWAPFVLAGSWD